MCLFEHLQKTIRLDAKEKHTLVLLVKERGNGMQIDRYRRYAFVEERKGKEGREKRKKETGVYIYI